MPTPAHVPVLLDRVVALVAPALARPGSVLVDATLGMGGHSEAVLTRCPEARGIGIDRDPGALDRSRERLAGVAGPVTFVHAVYDEITEALPEQGRPPGGGGLFHPRAAHNQVRVAERRPP